MKLLTYAMRCHVLWEKTKNADFVFNSNNFLSSEDGYLLRDALSNVQLPKYDYLVALTYASTSIAYSINRNYYAMTVNHHGGYSLPHLSSIFYISKGYRILIVKDAVTKGEVTKGAIKWLQDLGYTVAGVFAVLDCGMAEFDVPYSYLIDSKTLTEDRFQPE